MRARRAGLLARIERLEAGKPADWSFRLDDGRTVKFSFATVLNVFLGGLEAVHGTGDGEPPEPPTREMLLISRAVSCPGDNSLLGASVLAAAREARERHEAGGGR